MDDNMLLSDAIERLVVKNIKTGEQFAVITHKDVFTANDNIVVRLKPNAGDCSTCDVKSAPTAALVKELEHREGVKTVKAAPYEDINIACTGPVIVLVVED